ncbi:hypothetical protein O3884_04100 [Gemella sp. 20925_1_85]|uniref:hypothetical protein n=1 Tax=Gemella sp. 20925_1_85 TaxID=3003690 RepID=UPI00352F87CA
MKNRNQHLLLNEKQCGLGMYLFGLSILGELSDNFTKESNFVENIVEDQGENIQRDAHDTQKITLLKCNKCHSDKNDLVDYKKKEISTVVGLLSVFN